MWKRRGTHEFYLPGQKPCQIRGSYLYDDPVIRVVQIFEYILLLYAIYAFNVYYLQIVDIILYSEVLLEVLNMQPSRGFTFRRF